MDPDFYSSTDLVERLCHAANNEDSPVAFLVGSALCFPDQPGGHGIPDVLGMIELIRNEFKATDAATEFEKALDSAKVNKYQQAFRFLHARKGQTVANQVVRSAVWTALDLSNWPPELPATNPYHADDATCSTLERNVTAWQLPAAVEAFGRLLVDCSDAFGRTVLTTNFDPLIGVSVTKHGGKHYRTVLHSDAELGQTYAEGAHIVHLHGYWYGTDTLHTPQQLTRPRSQLSKSLGRVLEGSTLVVIGYGGWDDVMTHTLVDLLADSASNPEIMWAFHDQDSSRITQSNRQLLTTLEPGIGRGRVSLYSGIDCAQLFCAIHNRLEPTYPAQSLVQSSRVLRTKVVEQYSNDGASRGVHVEIEFPLPPTLASSPDRPLFAERWVGREHELNILATADAPVAFVTGIGGQGKSALAAELLRRHADTPNGEFEFWDWRDCREESDRLRTQLLRLIERLADGAIDASRVDGADIKAIVRILFQLLADRTALLVFDNVDQYVDLQTLELVKDLDTLCFAAQTHNHRSLFLFTCRPDVRIDESRAFTLSLQGLEEAEVKDLVSAQGIREANNLASELHHLTDGHPLWVNLILMQARRTPEGLRREIEAVRNGGPTLPDTTRRIWNALNDQQKRILRTMAELDHPETEANLLALLPGINFNRVNKALRTLRSFHLVELRSHASGEPQLSLHPLIREFVRTNFPKRDRERYIGAILEFLDRMISRFQGILPQAPTYEVMEHWIRKADLHITFERYEDATDTIAEIGPSLTSRGYSEALVRLSVRLFERVNWAEACSAYKQFDAVFQTSITAMIESGHDATSTYLTRFEDAIPGKSAQFILLCNLRCYADWYLKAFESAIAWGETGKRLRESTPVDTQHSTTHHLALARRDNGLFDEALQDFLGDESLDDVLAGSGPAHKDAPFFGNIGRCLYLVGRLDHALICYIKSARLLEAKREPSSRLNKGYIRLWFGELLEDRAEYELSAAMYRASVHMWHDSSPPRADQARNRLDALIAKHPSLDQFDKEPEWRVEAQYASWLSTHH